MSVQFKEVSRKSPSEGSRCSFLYITIFFKEFKIEYFGCFSFIIGSNSRATILFL